MGDSQFIGWVYLSGHCLQSRGSGFFAIYGPHRPIFGHLIYLFARDQRQDSRGHFRHDVRPRSMVWQIQQNPERRNVMKILCICTPVPVVIECREKSTFIYTSKFVVNLNHEVSQEVSLEPCPYPSYRRRVIFLMCHVMMSGVGWSF